MANRVDLYSILIAYANKNNSPYIDIAAFLAALEKYAKRNAAEHPEWQKWTQDTSLKFWAEMSPLVEEGKCELLADTAEGRIYIPNYYADIIEKAYAKPDDTEGLPFPSGDSLKITLPENQIRSLNVTYDFLPYLEDPQESRLPILKIEFPENFGSALILSAMIPRQIIEVSLLKVRHYLRSHSNKEFAQHKLTPQLQGKEVYLRDILNQLLIRPLECFNSLEEGGENSCLFWAHFCILVKNDIKKKKERSAADIGVVQAAYVLELINSHYKNLAFKRKEAELALKALEQRLDKPPLLFTLDVILKFTNNKGTLLLGQYSREELEAWLKEKTTKGEGNALPELLIVQGLQDERWYILKSKMLPLCSRLLAEGRIMVREAITKYWVKLLLDYRREPAMDDDKEFHKLLKRYVRKLCPTLTALLENSKLMLVYGELERNQGEIPSGSRIFEKGELLPYTDLLLIRRKDMLTDARILLPVWHTIPILGAIIAFFKNLGRKKPVKKQRAGDEEETMKKPENKKDSARELRQSAQTLEAAMVPGNQSPESYLADLAGRWSHLLDQKARQNLVEDVNSLVRNYLRQTFRLQKHFILTEDRLGQMADNIVSRTASLQGIRNQDALQLYIKLYLIKLLKVINF